MAKGQIYIGLPSIGTDIHEKLQVLAQHYGIESMPDLVRWIIISQYVEVRKNDIQRSKILGTSHGDRQNHANY
jgi:hypothetical protein